MAVRILASRLSFEQPRIYLSAAAPKHIGETEKYLNRAFEPARRANAIPFIGEADALFGKRSEAKDAYDRYASVETTYLLQKMEDYEGVVMLATVFAANIDQAFSRRMFFVVAFSLPDVACHGRLWGGMFRPGAPRAPDVDRVPCAQVAADTDD